MKKVLLFLGVIFALSMFSCTETELDNDKQNTGEGGPDPTEVCPPNDRNCNGIPDDQE